MKKLISAIVFLILATPLCFGLEDFHFSISPRVSMLAGELKEQLYYPDSDSKLISQLYWEQKPLFNVGLGADCSYKDFKLSAGFDYSFPVGTSYMSDYDYFGNGDVESFTEHPIEKSVNIDTDLTLAYQIKVFDKLYVSPELGFNYIYSDFKAGHGSGYVEESNGRRKKKVYGIDYKRHSFFIFTGVGLKTEITPKIFLNTAFLIAPWGYQYSFDYHHGVKNPFSSEMIQYTFFTKYKAEISTDFILNKTITLQIFTKALFGFADRGDFASDFNSKTLARYPRQQSASTLNYIKAGTAVIFNF